MFFKLKSRLRAFLAKQRATSEPERTEQALTMLRIIAGGFMIPHGISALTGGGQSMAVIALTRNGFEPSSMAIWLSCF